jgi:hypothetical protein
VLWARRTYKIMAWIQLCRRPQRADIDYFTAVDAQDRPRATREAEIGSEKALRRIQGHRSGPPLAKHWNPRSRDRRAAAFEKCAADGFFHGFSGGGPRSLCP